jgi:hypothetical protein
MFWVMVLMAIVVFAPCVLLPEWRQYQALRLAEQAEEHRVEQARLALARERAALEAMRSDPGVIARVAQRDLQFRRVDEREIAVALPAVADAPAHEPFVPRAEQLPAPLARAARNLPAFDYDQLFCDPRTNRILMALSIGLIGVAFGFVGRRRPETARPAL